MPTIARIGSLKVQVFPDDHYPPHFHIVGPDFEMLVTISDMVVLKGARHARLASNALEWAATHTEILLAEWARLNE